MDAAGNQFLVRLAGYNCIQLGRMRGLKRKNSLEIQAGFFGTRKNDFRSGAPPRKKHPNDEWSKNGNFASTRMTLKYCNFLMRECDLIDL